MIECTKCSLELPETSFTKGKTVCKPCRNLYSKQHLQNNKQYYRDRNKAKRLKIQEYIRAYKEEQGCIDCKTKFPYYVLDFDHVDTVNKVTEVSDATMLHTWKKALTEIAKCEVVCSNCHRVRTHSRKQQGLAQKKSAGIGNQRSR